MTARKELEGKPDLSLIPYCVEVELARAMMFGARKYGRNNFCDGHNLTQLIAAAKRHLGKCLDGEDLDPDSEVHHLAHAMANCLMALRQRQLGTLRDDRYKPPTKEPAMDKLWVVRAHGKYCRDAIVCGYYPDVKTAQHMAAQFHSKLYSEPNFSLTVEREDAAA